MREQQKTKYLTMQLTRDYNRFYLLRLARINPSGWQKYNFYCAKLAGLALAMGDNEAARAHVEIGTTNFADKQMMIWLPRAIAMKNISRDKNGRCNLDEAFRTPPSNRDRTFYFSQIAYYLAKTGDAEATAEFAERFRKLRYYDSYCEFSLAKADSLVGEFDRARLNWKKYPTNDTGLWSLYLLSFIIRQEFLAGEFRGWETMAIGEKRIDNLRAVYKGDDFSQCVSGFYFDYGRGIARHKSEKEIIDESENLYPTLEESDLAFFMAGVATGLQDRKNPKQKTTREVSENLQDNNETPTSNLHDLPPVQTRVQSDETIETDQHETVERNTNNSNVRRTRGNGSNIVEQIGRGYRTYKTIRNIIGR